MSTRGCNPNFTNQLNRFPGNLTIRLSSGLNVTIPNHQLVRPEILADDSGKRYITNHSIREIYMAKGERPWVFGSPFLSSVYLHVNNDEGKFTLWEANPTVKEDLVRVVNKQVAAKCSRLLPTDPPKSSKSRSKGVEIGAGIGGAAALFIIGCVIFAIRYRRRRARQQNKNITGSTS